jgi:transcriptional regulator with XRE-family HTH domain
MTVERACEFLQLRRMQLRFSYQKVADLTNLSIVTVKRILTGKIKDPSFLSMQALTYVLISDPKGKYPCAMHLLSKETNQAIVDCQTAQAALAQKEKEFERELDNERKKVSHLKEQIKFNETQISVMDKIIEDRASFMKNKDRYIFVLALLLGLSLAVIFGAMIVDALNSSIGFFWLK